MARFAGGSRVGARSACRLLVFFVATHVVNPVAIAALVVGALADLGRLPALRRNARLRPMSSLAAAIGVKHPRIEQKAQGFMGGSFNTREFFHARTRDGARGALAIERVSPRAGSRPPRSYRRSDRT